MRKTLKRQALEYIAESIIWADWMPNFCPHCGAPMTDEGVDMVMERLEALGYGKDD